jgi:hypothetical protein
MLQIILLLVVAGVAAYFIATSRKSKVEEVSKATTPKNPTFDPVVHAPLPVEEVFVDANPIASVQQVEELKEAKKVIKKKAAPKKKATK